MERSSVPPATSHAGDPAFRRRKPTAVRRGEIAEAAMRVLATRGARGFTARALAREVGLTDGAVFRHFTGMDEVLGAVVERMDALLFAGAAAQADPWARLRGFFERRAEAILERPHLARLLLSDQLAQLAPAHAARIAEFKRRTRDLVLHSLREAQRERTLRAGVTPGAAALLVQGAILSLAHAETDPALARRRAAELWSALETALRAEPGAAARRPAPARPGPVARRGARPQDGARHGAPRRAS